MPFAFCPFGVAELSPDLIIEPVAIAHVVGNMVGIFVDEAPDKVPDKVRSQTYTRKCVS